MRDRTIGEAARDSGVKVTTIRFYEARGLLTAPPRSEGNRRLYDAAAVARLRFIHHAREMGFPLDEVAGLLDLAGDPAAPCDGADAIARRHLAAVEQRIARLNRLRDELSRMVATCAGTATADCGVIAGLADHSRCAGPHDG